MSGTQEAVAMATAECPYKVGQKVQLIGRDGREDARVLAIHHNSRGVEIVVRTIDLVDAPGRNVNVFTTSGRSSWLAPISALTTVQAAS
jgi:hypothetical protein